MANTDTTCAASDSPTANTRDNSGNMASQTRCVAMLENVANDNSRMERCVAIDGVAGELAIMGAAPRLCNAPGAWTTTLRTYQQWARK